MININSNHYYLLITYQPNFIYTKAHFLTSLWVLLSLNFTSEEKKSSERLSNLSQIVQLLNTGFENGLVLLLILIMEKR